MKETSREGFVPRHLRGRDIPNQHDTCKWYHIADNWGLERQPCRNPTVTNTGILLCEDHLRKVGYASGMMTRKRAEEWLTSGHEHTIGLLRDEIRRLNFRAQWQARRLRGENIHGEPPPRTNDGTIYALLSGYNVKIGWTGRDLQARLREYPPNSQLLVHFPGRRGDETRIKRKFAHLRTHGNEWFPYAPQVTEWVDLMVREHGAPNPGITCGPAKYRTPRPHSQRDTIVPHQWRGARPA